MSTPVIDRRPERLIPRCGFLVHNAELLFHFLPVMEQLGPELVELVLISVDPEEERVLTQAVAHLPFPCRDARELLLGGWGYRWLVSNHSHGAYHVAGKSFYLIRSLGQTNIRLLYDLGADGWNYAPLNRLFDFFLCFGPWHVARLQAFEGIKLQMGCPRFDRFFTEPCARDVQLKTFGCDPAKPVVVWFSTLRSYHGVLDRFAPAVSRLLPDYNVIVKPHPFSWQVEPDFVKALDGLRFSTVLAAPCDNVILFQLADFVISDYGSLPFDALYTDRNLLLLDHPDYPGRDSDDQLICDTEQWLRRYIPHLACSEADQLPRYLANESIWQEQARRRAWLRPGFFAPYYGFASRMAAHLLRQIMENR
ncbi:MAG: CDP-glycerol glycerophosphotransferase family protein [Candidatus Sericytochromatia bacterium]